MRIRIPIAFAVRFPSTFPRFALLSSGAPFARAARTLVLGGSIWLLSGCADDWPEPPPLDPALLAAEHSEWREYRAGRLVEPPGGPVLWVGLWELPEGETTFGGSDEAGITLDREDVPALVATLRREGSRVTLEPAPRAPVTLDDGTPVVESLELADDRSDEPTTLRLGPLGLRVHAEPGTDRLWLRAWDEDHPDRETFVLPEAFPVEPSWVVPARFEAYPEARPLRVPDVTGGTVEYQARGELVFRKDGREHRMIATAGDNSSSFFVMMWDSTATTETYQAGRYLRVDFPDEDGWTSIDFNRAYNAPCVFTPYSVCALPPRENWLELAVTAGEKRPAEG